MARYRKGDAGERRTAALCVQLTPSERAELDRRAATVGHRLSDFSRVVLLSDLKKPAPSARDPQAIRALAAQLAHLGNNLNQMAHIANQNRDLPSEKALERMLDEIKGLLAKVWAL